MPLGRCACVCLVAFACVCVCVCVCRCVCMCVLVFVWCVYLLMLTGVWFSSLPLGSQPIAEYQAPVLDGEPGVWLERLHIQNVSEYSSTHLYVKITVTEENRGRIIVCKRLCMVPVLLCFLWFVWLLSDVYGAVCFSRCRTSTLSHASEVGRERLLPH
jgi:hypothetical protein